MLNLRVWTMSGSSGNRIKPSWTNLFNIRGDGVLEEAGFVLLEDHLDWARPEAVRDGKHDLPHLRPEVLEVDVATAVAVDAVQDGVIDAGQLLRHGGDVHAKVGLGAAHRLEGLMEGRPGEDAVAIEVQGGEPLSPPCPTAAPQIAVTTVEAANATLGNGRCPILGRAAANRCHCTAFFPVLPSPLLSPSYTFRFLFLALRDVPPASPSNPKAMAESPPPPDLEVMLGVYGRGVSSTLASMAKAQLDVASSSAIGNDLC
ncbi:hypothetical protein NL676_003738 [Syzygium grande]|nr:hypothetical protein NL676_003738 [Syzygium grande]